MYWATFLAVFSQAHLVTLALASLEQVLLDPGLSETFSPLSALRTKAMLKTAATKKVGMRDFCIF
jgi:hypothetical protein